jgi:6,7-dimethyl-8-ribityllumazine synthase
MAVRVHRIGVDGDGGGEGARSWRVGVVVSRYNGWVTGKLEAGALEALERLSGGAGEAVLVGVSGSLEVPGLVAEMAAGGGFDAVVGLGCVIRGETEHDRHIARAIIQSMVTVGASTGVAIGVGVLTVNDAEQAEARAGGALGNKGAEAMEAALASAAAMGELRSLGGGVSRG